MLVRALCLRHLGVKLTPAQLRQEVPMVGRLRYEASYYGGKDGNGAYACLLMPVSGGTDPEVQLHHAKVVKIEPRGLLIQGLEYVFRRRERESYPQMLWCWSIQPGELRRALPDPMALEDENEALRQALT
jgi:hypothetical protein